MNGTSQYEGRVEFCYRGQWGTVCDDFWGPAEATVVCRQLDLNLTLNGKHNSVLAVSSHFLLGT